MKFCVEAVNISEHKGTAKHAVASVTLVANHGIAGDAHAGNWHRQVSFLAGEAVDTMRGRGVQLEPGAFGENIVTRGFDWTQAKIGARVTIGEAELEITQIGKECHSRCAIYDQTGDCIMPRAGVFAKVLQGGLIHVNDSGHYHI